MYFFTVLWMNASYVGEVFAQLRVIITVLSMALSGVETRGHVGYLVDLKALSAAHTHLVLAKQRGYRGKRNHTGRTFPYILSFSSVFRRACQIILNLKIYTSQNRNIFLDMEIWQMGKFTSDFTTVNNDISTSSFPHASFL